MYCKLSSYISLGVIVLINQPNLGRTGKRGDSKHVCHHLPNVTQRLGSTVAGAAIIIICKIRELLGENDV